MTQFIPRLTSRPINRRQFIGGSVAAAAMLGCSAGIEDPSGGGITGNPRINATYAAHTKTSVPGTIPIGLDAPRDGVIYIPPSYDPTKATPLVLGLHGAGGSGATFASAMRTAADAVGAVVLAPDSRGHTWDGVTGSFGEDIDFIGRALVKTFDLVNVDQTKLILAGFSDGATYSLTLAIANGDKFGHSIAFSPGFFVGTTPHGTPKFFIAHGTSDTVLPIDECSRKIVPALQASGYEVMYHEFDGTHMINTGERDAAFAWMLT